MPQPTLPQSKLQELWCNLWQKRFITLTPDVLSTASLSNIRPHDIQHNDPQHNDIQHYKKWNATLSIMAFYAECCYAGSHYAVCRYAECRYAECRSSKYLIRIKHFWQQQTH